MKFSKVMLGTVQFGLNYGIANTSGKPSYESARDIIACAYEQGVNTLDTAAAYGNSEEVLGRALSELNLKYKVQIISKVPPVSEQNLSASEAEKFIVESVESSLRRLGIDQLSAVLFHREADIEYLEILNKLEHRGLIGGAGVSIDTNAYCDKVLELGINYVQLPYNIFDKRFDDFLEKAAKNNTKVFTRGLYLQGLLLMPESAIKPFLKDVIPVRRKLHQLAKQAGMSMPELCVRFVLNNPAITSVLTGVDNLDQLNQNLNLFNKGTLSPELYQEILDTVPAFSEEIVRPTNWNKHL